MHRSIILVLVLALILSLGAGSLRVVAQTVSQVPPGYDEIVACTPPELMAVQRLAPDQVRLTCALPPTPTPTATPVPTATATATPVPTATPVVSGWHAPGAHSGLGVHEHGDAPPAWVLASAWQPFTQSRESHVGYKGAYATTPAAGGGTIESYFIGHILSTAGARSHGDHDYQLWIREPNGAVSYWEGVLCFADPCTAPIPTHAKRSSNPDPGFRPIILGVDATSLAQGFSECETWYGKAQAFDVGWTICGLIDRLDGPGQGDGTFRTVDWIAFPDRLDGPQARFVSPTLASRCVVAYGVCRFTFLVSSRDYGDADRPN